MSNNHKLTLLQLSGLKLLLMTVKCLELFKIIISDTLLDKMLETQPDIWGYIKQGTGLLTPNKTGVHAYACLQ